MLAANRCKCETRHFEVCLLTNPQIFLALNRPFPCSAHSNLRADS